MRASSASVSGGFSANAAVLAAPTHATTPGAAPPAAVQALLPGLQPAGTARLTVWGFPVYEARLWVTPGFTPDSR